MKVTFLSNRQKIEVNFNTTKTKSGFAVMAKTSKDLDKLQDLVANSNKTLIIQKGLEEYIMKKLDLDIYTDDNYQGAGYGFKINYYTILNKL